MRSLIPATALIALAACSTAPPPPAAPDPKALELLEHHLAGKTPGPPVACLPGWRTNDMIVVDEDTILFRDTSKRVFRTEIPGGCPGLGWGRNSLVFRNIGTTQLCAGEIAQVVDLSTGMLSGTCSLGPFVPYTAP